ncbi:MAG: GreA/GreB family elongation factor [Marinoscillum sp.]
MKKRIVTISDYERLMAGRYYALYRTKYPEQLELFFCELMSAELVDQTQISEDVITMNSQVLLNERRLGRQMKLTLKYPNEANIKEQKPSVFDPIGMAVFGRAVGDRITWTVFGRNVEFEVLKVIYQPEAVGQFEL